MEPVRVLGMMSGTSLDGVDAALMRTDGEGLAAPGRSAYRPYAPAERAVLRAALGRWPGEAGVAEAARIVEDAHAEVAAGFSEAELLAFHGQTLAHDPGGRGTHQAGSGARLAALTGRAVAWDFRSADVAAGGQGAPLVPFYHFALARRMGAGPVAFLNLGGVGNLTWADPGAAGPEAAGALVAFDTGPANAPIDDLMAARRGLPRDEGGTLACAGRVDGAVVAAFARHGHFARPAPKSLDRDAFAGLLGAVAHLRDADAAATLAACAARAVALGLGCLPAPPGRLIVAGGGRRNAGLMARIAAEISPLVPEPAEAAGLDGDMLEAQAFAYLGMRVRRGLPLSAPGTTGVARPMPGGRIALP